MAQWLTGLQPRGTPSVSLFFSRIQRTSPGTHRSIQDNNKATVGRWEGGGTHTGPAFGDFPIGALPEATGRAMRFTGTTALQQLGLIAAAQA